MLLSFLLVPIKRDLALSNWELSFLLGTTLAATAAGGIAFGAPADRFGRKRVLTWTLLTLGRLLRPLHRPLGMAAAGDEGNGDS